MMAVTPLPGRFQGPSPCPDNTTFCNGVCYTSLREVFAYGDSPLPKTICNSPAEQLPLPTTQPEIQCLVDLASSYTGERTVDEILTGYINKATTFETSDGSVVAPADIVGTKGPNGDSKRCVIVDADAIADAKLERGCDDYFAYYSCQVPPVEG